MLPLVYNALESEHPAVQERALEAVPDLCETIDYAEVQSVLFPRVAVCFNRTIQLRPSRTNVGFTSQLVFTKTRILSVKVSTLTCFLAMVKTLDQVYPFNYALDSADSAILLHPGESHSEARTTPIENKN